MNEKLKISFQVVLIVILFLLVSYFVQTNLDYFKEPIAKNKVWGAIIYILLIIAATVIAPLTTIPLIPLASSIYGWFLAGVITYIGWLIASMIVFYISRKWGKPFVKKFVSLDKIKSVEKSISRKNRMGALIFLRMTLPVDILSYALGLFSSISWRTYIISAAIGFIPFTFLLTYLGSLPFLYQVIGSLIIGIIVTISIIVELSIKNESDDPKSSS